VSYAGMVLIWALPLLSIQLALQCTSKQNWASEVMWFDAMMVMLCMRKRYIPRTTLTSIIITAFCFIHCLYKWAKYSWQKENQNSLWVRVSGISFERQSQYFYVASWAEFILFGVWQKYREFVICINRNKWFCVTFISEKID